MQRFDPPAHERERRIMPLATINPTTGETVREFPELSQSEIDAKLDAARAAFRVHRQSSFRERAEKLRRRVLSAGLVPVRP